jgi:hypothetical protein
LSWWQFGKRGKSAALELLGGAEWTCTQCELPHRGMFDLAPSAPDPWPGGLDHAPNSALSLEGDFLSDDFCVMGGEYFMVRCVLDIPVHGLDRSFGFGCWGSLSRTNFEAYVDNFDNGDFQGAGPWSSWMCNRFFTYVGSDPLACQMFPQLDRQRPVLRVQDEAHPLAVAQQHGISAEHVLEIYRHYGHAIAA